MSDNTRIAWIDVTKTVAIILVVLGHVWRGLNEAGAVDDSIFSPLDTAIYLFHMPLFLMISGFLFSVGYDKPWKTLLKRQAIFIIWPYVLWSVIIVSIKVVMSSSVNNESSFENLLHILYKPVSIFWFLYVLFLSQCFVKFVYERVSSMNLLMVLGCGLFLLHFYLSLDAVPIVNLAFQFMLYFIFGFCWAQLLKSSSATLSMILKVEPSLYKAAIASVIFASVLSISLFYGITLHSFWIPIIGVTLSLCVITVCSYIGGITSDKRSLFYMVSMSTMAIYVSHVIFTAAVRVVLLKLDVTSLFIHVSLGTILGLIVPIIMYEVSNRLKLTTILGLGILKR